MSSVDTPATIHPETPTALKMLATAAWHRIWCDYCAALDHCDCGLPDRLATIEDEARALYHDRLVAEGWHKHFPGDPGQIKAQLVAEGGCG